MTDTITIVRGDDWEGLYYNGVLQIEGHSLSSQRVLDTVSNFAPFAVAVVYVDSNWLDDVGYLPRDLDKVRLEEDE